MTYPELDPVVGKARQERAIKQMRVGDIVEGWLDCTPDPGCTRPLPMVILKTPALRESLFTVKSIFSKEEFLVNFYHQWRIVGHVEGLAELLATEEAAHVNAAIAERTSLSALSTREDR